MKPRPTPPGALPVHVIYQQLLAFLLEHHYGLSLNDTPYHDEQVIAQQIEQGISVGDTVNTLVEKYALVRIGRTGFSALAQDPMLSKGDIARARQAAGLWRAHFPPTLLYPTDPPQSYSTTEMINMDNNITTAPTWGLKRDITPRLGARLVQQGTHLHFLSDRANIVGTFSLEATQSLDAAFPALITKLESQLLSGTLDPRRQQGITVRHGEWVCDADTLGSHGHVYIAIYSTPPARA